MSISSAFIPIFAAVMEATDLKLDNITTDKSSRAVAIWLYIGVGMLIVQVLLGGITRLTGSGLSITEWQPLLGAFPPMNEAAWQKAFEGYKQIAQYKYLNNHFTLSDFKAIYFWEWLHRDWARLMGVVFIVPFIYFLIKKKINAGMINPMIILFVLGGLQGLIGWIMVASGLNDENLYVSHIRLAIHFISALVLLGYVFWFALKLSIPLTEQLFVPGLKKLNIWLLVILVFQLIYGAFMAGIHAALAASTWPDINGFWLPPGFLTDIFHNPIAIQFIHRGLAYIITVLVAIWWWKSGQTPTESLLHKTRYLPLLLVLLQVLLGVLTILNSQVNIPISYAILHQAVGMLLLLSLIWTLFLSRSTAKSIALNS